MTKEVIDNYLKEMSELHTRISNELAQIDSIDECLCPNTEEEIDTYMTPEQWNERQKIKRSLEWTICVEFPHLIKDEYSVSYGNKYWDNK